MTNKAKIITEIQNKRIMMLSFRCKAKSKALRDKYDYISQILQYQCDLIAEKLGVCPLCGIETDYDYIDEGWGEFYKVCVECGLSEYSHHEGNDPWDL